MASLDDLKIDRSRKGRPALKWTLLVVVLLVALVGGGAAAWQWWTESQVLTVDTAVVRQTTAGDGQPTVLNASGYVTARRQATVSSKVTGKVVEVLVEEGMVVQKGQVLARLDDTTERSYLALAEAQVQAASGALAELEVRHAEALLDLERKEQLLKRGIIGGGPRRAEPELRLRHLRAGLLDAGPADPHWGRALRLVQQLAGRGLASGGLLLAGARRGRHR